MVGGEWSGTFLGASSQKTIGNGRVTAKKNYNFVTNSCNEVVIKL